MKKLDIVRTYGMLKSAKLTKVDDADKFKIISVMRAMRPVYEQYAADEQEATEKLKDERFSEMSEKGRRHDEAIRQGRKDGLLSPEEAFEVKTYFDTLQGKLDKYLSEIREEEADIKYDRISAHALEKLIASGDYTCEEIMLLQDCLN